MELNWSTFALEIINFLVLIWILKRFFYKPILGVIARRRASIEESLTEARTLHDEAEALDARYQDRLSDWEQERQLLREKLTREIDEQRTQRLADLQSELNQEREKALAAETRRRTEAIHQAEETAMILAARFSSRVLGLAAGPELEAKLLELFIQQLPQLSAERIASLRNSWKQGSEAIAVATAFPLSEARRRQLQEAFVAATGADFPLTFEEDAELLAGVRITAGAWVLGANLQDELRSFAEFTHDVRDT